MLENPKADWADRELFSHKGRWAKGDDPNDSKLKNFAVRSARWRLVGTSELYDIPKDPYEKVNVFDQHPQAVRYEKQLKERGIPDWKLLPF